MLGNRQEIGLGQGSPRPPQARGRAAAPEGTPHTGVVGAKICQGEKTQGTLSKGKGAGRKGWQVRASSLPRSRVTWDTGHRTQDTGHTWAVPSRGSSRETQRQGFRRGLGTGPPLPGTYRFQTPGRKVGV